jgi:hypothetical protein
MSNYLYTLVLVIISLVLIIKGQVVVGTAGVRS